MQRWAPATLPDDLDRADLLEPFGDQPIETSAVDIGDHCDVTADDLVAAGDRRDAPKNLAMKFLRELLADGPHKATEAYRLVEDDGISESTLKRAKRDLDVQAYQKDRVWWWELPAEEDELPDEEDKEE